MADTGKRQAADSGKVKGRKMKKDWKKERKRWLSGSLAVLLGLTTTAAGMPMSVQAAGEVRPDAILSTTEMAELVSDTWDEDYFGKIVIDPEDGTVEKDGEEQASVYSLDHPSAGNKKSEEKIIDDYLDVLPEDSLYTVKKNDGGEYEITAPFQTRRLIVEEGSLDKNYGAEEIYANEDLNETILQFDTEEETKKAYEKLCQRYGKENCYPDEIYHVDDLLTALPASGGSYSWGTAYMGMTELKSRAASAGHTAPVTVAVLDTGIDKANFLFRGRSVSSRSYNFVDNNKNVVDTHGHGTHVSGIIADSTPSNVQILMLKISNSSGYSSLLTIKSALQYALNQDIAVVNMSVGFVGARAITCTYLDDLIDKAYKRGIPICAAAGNNGVDVAFCYPACNQKTIAISSVDTSERLAYYSNRRSLIDFCAPGSQVVSAKAGGTLVSMSGTSMSAPHIAAAAAYLKMMQGNLSVQGIYEELKLRCKDLGSYGKDPYYGWGCPVMTDLFDRGIVNKSQVVTGAVKTPKLKSVKNTEKGVRVTWGKVKGAGKYYLYRKTGNGNYKKIKEIAGKSRSYLDKKVSQGKRYTYALKAVKGKKKSLRSAGKETVWLKAPARVRAGNAKGKTILIRWKKQSGVSGYQIRISDKKNGKKAKTVRVTGKKARKKIGRLKKKIWYYRVRACKTVRGKNWYSSWSATGKIRVR